MKKTFFVHESSDIEKNVKIGRGTDIWHYTHVRSGAVIGKFCNIGQNVFIDTDVKIGNGVKIQNNVSVYRKVILEDGVFCGPSCVFTNVLNPRAFSTRKLSEYLETNVKKGATIGANATIVCGNNIGEFAFVGAGAVVTKDVRNYAIVVGNPAKQVGWICECGAKLNFSLNSNRVKCRNCGKKYKKKKSHGGVIEVIEVEGKCK